MAAPSTNLAQAKLRKVEADAAVVAAELKAARANALVAEAELEVAEAMKACTDGSEHIQTPPGLPSTFASRPPSSSASTSKQDKLVGGIL